MPHEYVVFSTGEILRSIPIFSDLNKIKNLVLNGIAVYNDKGECAGYVRTVNKKDIYKRLYSMGKPSVYGYFNIPILDTQRYNDMSYDGFHFKGGEIKISAKERAKGHIISNAIINKKGVLQTSDLQKLDKTLQKEEYGRQIINMFSRRGIGEGKKYSYEEKGGLKFYPPSIDERIKNTMQKVKNKCAKIKKGFVDSNNLKKSASDYNDKLFDR